MKTTEMETERCYLTIDDNELYCPLVGGTCLSDICALAVFTEELDGSTYYCGLVATHENTRWNESGGASLHAKWTKCVTRDRKTVE